MKVTSVILILFCFGVMAQAQSNGQSAPALDLKDMQGRLIRLADYKGDVVMLNFWATWCPPCRAEIPDLIKLQRTYRRQGLRIIGITYPPQTPGEVAAYLRKMKMNYPVALGSKATKESFTPSNALPVTVIVDRKGDVHAVIEGTVYADEFDREVKPLLEAERAAAARAIPRKPQPRRSHGMKIIVNENGYQPSAVRLRKGVPARLTFIRTAEQSCGTEIAIPAYGINRPLPLNVPVVIRFTPRKAGRFKFTCGMDMFRGVLVVR
ncbi:MAG TPA: redoxin domain-containing protein [Pyrinomonadaceae bacterium]|nr:redoxin domain-containing protein [Pyrinomonadaceae bacterium]